MKINKVLLTLGLCVTLNSVNSMAPNVPVDGIVSAMIPLNIGFLAVEDTGIIRYGHGAPHHIYQGANPVTHYQAPQTITATVNGAQRVFNPTRAILGELRDGIGGDVVVRVDGGPDRTVSAFILTGRADNINLDMAHRVFGTQQFQNMTAIEPNRLPEEVLAYQDAEGLHVIKCHPYGHRCLQANKTLGAAGRIDGVTVEGENVNVNIHGQPLMTFMHADFRELPL